MSKRKPSAMRVASRHLGIPMSKTAGEVRFIKDRGGDEKNFAWANTGPSVREITKGFEFSPAKLKPLAKCLRATLMALGHAQSAYHDFTKIKSAQISPDGNLGGKGYIQQITEMRRTYMNVSEALSALSDTIYDEINAPHWAVQAGEEQATSRTRDDVAEIMDDVEEIRENPEEVAEDMEEKWENEPGHAKTAKLTDIPPTAQHFEDSLYELERAARKLKRLFKQHPMIAQDNGQGKTAEKLVSDTLKAVKKLQDYPILLTVYADHHLQNRKASKIAMDSDQRDLYDKVMMVAKNDGRAYAARKPSDAIDNAFKEHKKWALRNLDDDFKSIRREMVKDLQIYWRRKKASASRVVDTYRSGR